MIVLNCLILNNRIWGFPVYNLFFMQRIFVTASKGGPVSALLSVCWSSFLFYWDICLTNRHLLCIFAVVDEKIEANTLAKRGKGKENTENSQRKAKEKVGSAFLYYTGMYAYENSRSGEEWIQCLTRNPQTSGVGLLYIHQAYVYFNFDQSDKIWFRNVINILLFWIKNSVFCLELKDCQIQINRLLSTGLDVKSCHF